MNIIGNALSFDLLNMLHTYTRDGKQPTKTNFFSYLPEVVGSSNAIFCFDLPNDLKTKVASEFLSKNIFLKEPTKWTATIQLFSRSSFIPWHDDRNHKFTATVYLNKIWDDDWGGYFAYRDGEEIKCIKPTYNTAVFFNTPLPHSVMYTANNAPLRESLQIFVDEY